MVLQAEAGSGKTTRVPPALLAAGLGPVFVLEPRRMAARLAAQRVADEMGETLGGRVGYQVRFDKVGGRETHIWFLTEGVFTNRLLSGQALPFGSVVLLDEFHERHVETDLALALLRRLLPERPDLRVALMSATLPKELVLQLGTAPSVDVPGRVFPIEVRYAGGWSVAQGVAAAVQETQGHVLVFLPGSAEIRAAIRECQAAGAGSQALLLPLYGTLEPAEQERALRPSSQRKIIFATNVAESSVTVEGVSAVVDSGLARLASHSVWTGIPRLTVGRVSQASAIQRAGRAGRTGPGLVIRLYPPEDFARRPASTAPEILRVDWADPLLRLEAHGTGPEELPWLQSPEVGHLAAGRALLQALGALDEGGGATSVGRQIAQLPIPPRLGCLAMAGAQGSVLAESAHLAAWLSEEAARLDRRAGARGRSDLELVLDSELSFAGRRTKKLLIDALRSVPGRRMEHALEKAVLRAFPDRVAAKKGDGFVLATGTAVRMDPGSSAAEARFAVAIDAEDRGEGQLPTVRLAMAADPDWLLDVFPDRIEAAEELRWNRTAERVEQVSLLRYQRLVIDETVGTPSAASAEAAAELLADKAWEAGWRQFAEAGPTERLLHRVRFAAEYGDGRVAVPEPETLLRGALRKLAAGSLSFAELRQAARAGWLPLVEAELDMRWLDEMAPSGVKLPSGRRAPIEYVAGQAPAVSSRLQDFFGMKETPAVARGRVPLTVKLLAPSGRPVQITTDLQSFWRDLYPQLRRELSRRYPRHAWPELPG